MEAEILLNSDLGEAVVKESDEGDALLNVVESIVKQPITEIHPSGNILLKDRPLEGTMTVPKVELNSIHTSVERISTGQTYILGKLVLDKFRDPKIWARLITSGALWGENEVEIHMKEWNLLILVNVEQKEDKCPSEIRLYLDGVKLEKTKKYWLEVSLVPHKRGILNEKLCEGSRFCAG